MPVFISASNMISRRWSVGENWVFVRPEAVFPPPPPTDRTNFEGDFFRRTRCHATDKSDTGKIKGAHVTCDGITKRGRRKPSLMSSYFTEAINQWGAAGVDATAAGAAVIVAMQDGN
jgi:hypothetical protein